MVAPLANCLLYTSIYGDDAVVAEFARIRRDVLAKERDLPTLAREGRERCV